MLNLIYEENCNIAELDEEYSKKVGVIVLLHSNEEIVKFIDYVEEKQGYSCFYNELRNFLFEEGIDADFLLFEATLETYVKYYELSKMLELDNYTLGIYIARFYYYNNNEEEAIKYYSDVFKPGFDLSKYNYYDNLVKYYELLKINPKEKIKELIDNCPKFDDYENDLINTYLLLIINSDKNSEEYLKFIKDATVLSRKLVRKYQEKNKNRNYLSDTEEERNLCELVALKLEYYVNKKEFVKAMNAYHELTDEIHRSDCMRYYHARDLFYNNMIKAMSEEYEELKFLIDIRYTRLEILDFFEDINDLLNKEITLKNENNKLFGFRVVRIYENDVTIVPILPVLGDGGLLFTQFEREENKNYLDVR